MKDIQAIKKHFDTRFDKLATSIQCGFTEAAADRADIRQILKNVITLEISQLKKDSKNHETRITALEQALAIPEK